MMNVADVYDGFLPVSDEWYEEHQGEFWAFQIPFSIGTLISLDWEGFSEMVDEILGFVLTDFSVERYDPIHDEIGAEEVMLRLTGMVMEW